MKIILIFGVLGIYLVIAFVIARFCAVNAGWEKIEEMIPKNGERGFAEPEKKSLGRAGDLPGHGDTNAQEA